MLVLRRPLAGWANSGRAKHHRGGLGNTLYGGEIMKWVRVAPASLTVLLLLACRFLTSTIQDRGGKTQEPGNQTQDTGSLGEPPGDISYIFEIPTNPVQIALTPLSTINCLPFGGGQTFAV